MSFSSEEIFLQPEDIVKELNKHVVGQLNAKKLVAIALRNRWRRQQVDEPLRSEITPKNILMIGPTGVGKTEIARRLAKLAGAPFIKVEATKFTEVGYVGKDVDSIIRDLVEVAVKHNLMLAKKQHLANAKEVAIERILDILIPNSIDVNKSRARNSKSRTKFRNMLLAGELDDTEIEIELSPLKSKVELMGPPGLEELTHQIQSMFNSSAFNKKHLSKTTVKHAMQSIIDEEATKMINEDEIIAHSVQQVEQHGIVFIDEIDKVAIRSDVKSSDVSSYGVQRDLLPLVEGTTVTTKYGLIHTEHILFIASGAFHLSKPSDLLPEMQGRFPIRVELMPLSATDFEKILVSTNGCLIEQYTALLATEGTEISFKKNAITRIAQLAFHVNETNENIGARRLYTIMEKLLEEELYLSQHKKILIDAKFVDGRLGEIAKSEDLSKYIL
jgi:ATP-dependent HslUV protease ATP-binding subunit HslU